MERPFALWWADGRFFVLTTVKMKATTTLTIREFETVIQAVLSTFNRKNYSIKREASKNIILYNIVHKSNKELMGRWEITHDKKEGISHSLHWFEKEFYLRDSLIQLFEVSHPDIIHRVRKQEEGTVTDMKDSRNFEWECKECKKWLPDKEEAIEHVQAEHGEAAIWPHLSQRGKVVAEVLYEEFLGPEFMVEMNEETICWEADARPLFVDRGERLRWRNTAVISQNEKTELQKEALAFREKCNNYLLAFYKKVYPDSEKSVNFYELGGELGFFRNETKAIEDFWKQREFIKRRSYFSSSYSMSPKGFDWVQNNLLGLQPISSAFGPQETMRDRKLQAEPVGESQETAVSTHHMETIPTDNTQKKRAKKLQPKPAGRKPDPVNEQVYQVLLDGDKDTAFAYWCEKNGITELPTPKARKQARDAFNKAMKRAERRRNRT